MARMVTEACVCLGVLDIATVRFLTALIYMKIEAVFLRYFRLSDPFFVVPRAQDGKKKKWLFVQLAFTLESVWPPIATLCMEVGISKHAMT